MKPTVWVTTNNGSSASSSSGFSSTVGDIIKTGAPLCQAIKAQTGFDIMGTLANRLKGDTIPLADSLVQESFTVGQRVTCKANNAIVLKVNYRGEKDDEVSGYEIQYDDGACESVSKEMVRKQY